MIYLEQLDVAVLHVRLGAVLGRLRRERHRQLAQAHELRQSQIVAPSELGEAPGGFVQLRLQVLYLVVLRLARLADCLPLRLERRLRERRRRVLSDLTKV